MGKLISKNKDEELTTQDDWLGEAEEGQLAIDAYQDNDNIVIKAPIAGVNVTDLEISITEEVVTIKGTRQNEGEVNRDDYLIQECYWGTFSRSYILPVSVDASKAEASMKNGILTISIPKQEKTKTRILKVEVS